MIDRARVVVVGGGVGGCSILYWLARLGWSDSVLVERAQLTSGSTFHSAGLVGQLRGSLSLTRMMMNSVELYRDLAGEVELETGWREVGSLRLASSTERMEELQRQAAWAETFGLPLQLVSAEEARKLFPPMSIDGVHGAAYLSTDGYLDPSQLTLALAKGARQRGATILTETRVNAIDVALGRVRAVETDHGRIECEVVVDAGGIYAHEIGRLAGVHVPVVPMAHQYVITKPADLPRDMPTVRDPSLLVYFRGESGGLVAGGYERNPAPWGLSGISGDFNNRLLPPDWDRFAPLFEAATLRVPELADAEIVQLVNGPEAFTPDGEFILGPSEVDGFWVAAGFCAHGIAGAGGMGRLVAEWIIDGQPGLDAWEMDSRRFGAQYRSREYALVRTTEVYSTYYDVKYPGHERQSGKTAPASARLRPAASPRCGLRGKGRLGEGQLVRVERGGRRRLAPPVRLGRPPLVAGGRRRAPGVPRDRCIVRRDVLLKARGHRAGRGLVPGALVREPCRAAAGHHHLHPALQSGRRRRVRPDGHSPGRGPLPRRHRDGVRQPRPCVAAFAPAWRRLGVCGGRDVALRLFRSVGTQRTCHLAAAHGDRPGKSGVSLHDRPRALGRAGAMPRTSGHVRR